MLVVTLLITVVVAVAATSARAAAWPTSRAALAWRPPAGFIRAAWCLHRHESVDWHRAWTDWTGARSPYAGGMQMLQSTWSRAGGRGEPWAWSPREQLYRTYRIWLRDGRSFREWGTARACGLR